MNSNLLDILFPKEPTEEDIMKNNFFDNFENAQSNLKRWLEEESSEEIKAICREALDENQENYDRLLIEEHETFNKLKQN